MSSLQTGFEVPPQSTLTIRNAALKVRQVLGLPDGRFDQGRLLEKLHEFGIVLDVFDNSNAPVGQGVEACWVPESRHLYIHDRVYKDACQNGTRSMFTISHELGHIVLAHQRPISRQIQRNEIPVYANSEWQANTFASEFAMPLPIMIREKLHSAPQTASFFGVSAQAAEVRLKKLTNEFKSKK